MDFFHILFHFKKPGLGRYGSCNKNNIVPRGVFFKASVAFSDKPFGSVPFDSGTDLLADRYSHPAKRKSVFMIIHYHASGLLTAPLFIKFCKNRIAFQRQRNFQAKDKLSFLKLSGKNPSALSSSSRKNFSAVFSAHSASESMHFFSLKLVGLICSKHKKHLLKSKIKNYRLFFIIYIKILFVNRKIKIFTKKINLIL